MRKLIVTLGLPVMLFSCSQAPLSKTDSALVGGLTGAGIGAVTHKHFKTSAKDAAGYGAVAGGIAGYVAGSNNKHEVDSTSSYNTTGKNGKPIHVHETWHSEDSQQAPSR